MSGPLFLQRVSLLLIGMLLAALSACAPSTKRSATPTPMITVATVGDTLLGASAEKVLKKQGYDHAFEGSRHLYADADLIIANLEGPLTSGGKRFKDKKYTFRSNPRRVAAALQAAGINAVTLANNHSLDYGPEGLADTMQVLDVYSIAHFGAGEDLSAARTPYIREVEGVRIGMLAYSLTYPEEFWAGKKQAGTAFGYRESVVEDVEALKQQADIVLVVFHWGRESATKLRPYQVSLAHAAIDAGADVIIGHHPHIAQAVELYRGKPVLYSLGNYVFGSYSSRATYGLLAKLQFSGTKLERLALIPLDVNNFRVQFRPVPAAGTRLEKACENLQQLSAERGAVLVREQDELVLQLSKPELLDPVVRGAGGGDGGHVDDIVN